jgi:hypothetical protein
MIDERGLVVSLLDGRWLNAFAPRESSIEQPLHASSLPGQQSSEGIGVQSEEACGAPMLLA